MNKRNWFKRAVRTFIQAAIPAGALAIANASGLGIDVWTGAAVAGAAAGIAAIQNAMENRKREGPVED